MRRWERVRFLLRSFSAIAGVVAASLVYAHRVELGGIFGLMATNALALATTLPRDRWTDEERRVRRQTPIEGSGV
jgi:hypothetical protein